MFKSARIKLTTWYLTIIMLVSLCFSFFIYRAVSTELEMGFRRAEIRHHAQDMGLQLPRRFSMRQEELRPELQEIAPRFLFIEDLEEAKRAVLFRLVTVNGVILLVSALASYLMAGNTLAPIEKAMEEQKRFVADASHELRTPLTALKTSMEVALREKQFNSKQAKIVLKEAVTDIDHLANLSTKMLRLSSLQQGSKIKFSAVDLSELVKDVTNKIKPLAREKEIQIETDLTKCIIEADSEQIREMITILIDNAIKYSNKKDKVKFTLKPLKKYVQIIIQDSGIGIAQKHLPHIFDRFYRVDSSRSKKKADGFGLGLSLAKQIIEVHEGRIDVVSRVEKGTTFIVKLPLKKS